MDEIQPRRRNFAFPAAVAGIFRGTKTYSVHGSFTLSADGTVAGLHNTFR